jgi:phosphoenolpyruvate carboxykinase (GTP)
VNWFRKNAQGDYAWPGFGENARILEWIVARVKGTAGGVETPVGTMPRYEDINWNGLEDMNQEKFANLTSLDAQKWQQEVSSSAEFFSKFEGPMPDTFPEIQHDLLVSFSAKMVGSPKEKLFEANL